MAEINGVMMQYFHWYTRGDGSLWREIAAQAKELHSVGITSVWLPPAYKGAAGGVDVGYAVYDLFDLGEFDQKGSVRTKYGTKDEFVAACAELSRVGIRAYADAVFNHKMGADIQEEVEAIPFSLDNRNEAVGGIEKISAWTGFRFPGRGDAYSSMKWHWYHFDAVDYDAFDVGQKAVFRFKDKSFASEVDLEKGNYDYLMGCDVDVSHPEVWEELCRWGKWIVEQAAVDGFRFDAVKHVRADFFLAWLREVSNRTGKALFAVGEYWSYELGALENFLRENQDQVHLFDAPLHLNFHIASEQGNSFDMRGIFRGTLVEAIPMLAVTLVENHDTQPLQSLESPVAAWFKPLAYALILLRRDGYPCIFYPDYYGAEYRDKGRDGQDYEIKIDSMKNILDSMLEARRRFSHGGQIEYFDHPNCVGWTRAGTPDFPGGMAVLMSNGDKGFKFMTTGNPSAAYFDITGNIPEPISTDLSGSAVFLCGPGSVSVWVPI